MKRFLLRKVWALYIFCIAYIIYRKWSAQIGHEENFQNYEITCKESVCLEQLKLKENKRNNSTYRFANKSLFVKNFRPLFIAVSRAIVMWILQELKMYWAKFLEGRQIIVAEKMR